MAGSAAFLLHVALENLIGTAWKPTNKHPAIRIEFRGTEVNGWLLYFAWDGGRASKIRRQALRRSSLTAAASRPRALEDLLEEDGLKAPAGDQRRSRGCTSGGTV